LSRKFIITKSMPIKIWQVLMLSILCANSSAQLIESASQASISDVIQFTNNTYGVNQQFLNGRFHEYKYRDALGHPFFLENQYTEGDLVLHGTLYHGIPMKYDIYSQEIIVRATINKRELPFYPPAEFINSFRIYGKDFERRSSITETPSYFQIVAEEGQISCLYFWYKTRQESDHKQTFNSFKFDKAKHINYLIINDEIYRFNSKKSFKKSFPNEFRNELSRYLKSEKIKIKSVSDSAMKDLINYSQALLNGIK